MKRFFWIGLLKRLVWFRNYRQKNQFYLVIEEMQEGKDILLSLTPRHHLEKLRTVLQDENEFLSWNGIRSLSTINDKPYHVKIHDTYCGDSILSACPAGCDQLVNSDQVARDISLGLILLVTKDSEGNRQLYNNHPQYQRDEQSAKTDNSITSTQIVNEYLDDQDAANQKYLDSDGNSKSCLSPGL